MVPGAGGVAGPDGLLYSIVAVAFILATSVVEAVAPSSRNIAFVALRASTTKDGDFVAIGAALRHRFLRDRLRHVEREYL